MNGTTKLNKSEWSVAMARLRSEVPDKAFPVVTNQIALDLAARNAEMTPPTNADAQRLAVKTFLREQLSQSVRLATSGKRKGSFIPNRARSRQLIRANLLVNWWRHKRGKPGLYGKDMKRYTGAFTGKRVRGVGFLKVLWLPIIRTLNAKAAFTASYTLLFKGIARWPGSSGQGTAQPAKAGWKPVAILRLSIKHLLKDDQEGKVSAIQKRVMEDAIRWKAGKVIRQIERGIQPWLNRVSAKRQ